MNEETTLIAETAERLFADLSTPETVNAAEQGTWPAALWDAFAETGLGSILVPESLGGAGGDVAHAAAILRAAARHAVPAPVAETMLAGWVAGMTGIVVPDGPASFAVGRGGHDGPRLHDGRLTGCLHRTPWGRAVETLVVVIDGAVALVPTGDAGLVEGRNLAGEPRDDLTFDDVPVAAAAAAEGLDAVRAYRLGALFRAVQIAGGLERILEMAVQYAGERKQFGRPLAKFQAIQHQLAILAGQTTAANAATDAAVAAVGSKAEDFAVAAAKARASEAAGEGAAIAHQVHGAMGFTHEHSLHQVTRRLWSWREEFGNEAVWTGHLGRAIAAGGADALWPTIVGA